MQLSTLTMSAKSTKNKNPKFFILLDLIEFKWLNDASVQCDIGIYSESSSLYFQFLHIWPWFSNKTQICPLCKVCIANTLLFILTFNMFTNKMCIDHFRLISLDKNRLFWFNQMLLDLFQFNLVDHKKIAKIVKTVWFAYLTSCTCKKLCHLKIP